LWHYAKEESTKKYIKPGETRDRPDEMVIAAVERCRLTPSNPLESTWKSALESRTW